MDLTLRLLRHGQTEWSDAGRYCGHHDVPLSIAGRQALGGVALPPADYTSVRCSDLRRCRETAEILGFAPTLEPALREFDFGRMEGLTWDELGDRDREALGDYDNFVAPGGESVASFRVRVEAFVDTLPSGIHLLITHGGVIQHLLRRERVDRRLAPGEWIDLVVSRR